MGVYLNPGNEAFEMTVNSRIYIDKTEMIDHLNSVISTEQRFIAVSRPRRFGKTIAVNMLCAYYGKTADGSLFQNLKIADCDDWDKFLGKFDVIRLVMTDFIRKNISVSDAIKKCSKRILTDLSEEYPGIEYDDDDLIYSMSRFYNYSGRKFVIVVDEWDVVFRERKEAEEEQKEYLDFLRDWLKGKDYIALAYMTGILPIKKYGKHSALNMFDEYSMLTPMHFAPYTGFTENEVTGLCREYNMDFKQISDWYDGYVVSDGIPVEMRDKYRENRYKGQLISIYSPLSVVKAVTTGYIQNYWNKTETYEALAEYIQMNYDGLKDAVAIMMDGGSVKVDVSTYRNDMLNFTCRDDILALLINLGYLKYNLSTSEVSIPNREILDEFKASTKSDEWIDTFASYKKSLELLNAIWSKDEETVAGLIEESHDRAGNKTYNDEAALSYGMQYAMYAAQKYYTTIQELDSGKGYADIVYLPSPEYPDKPALIMELKYNKDVKTASDQIREKNYPQVLEHYAGNILVVSINYDKELKSSESGFKHHSCRIEMV